MAHTSSARKRVRQAEARRVRHRAQRSALRSLLKKVVATVQTGERDAAVAVFRRAVRSLDRAARKGLIHKNEAARRKSRLAARVAALKSA